MHKRDRHTHTHRHTAWRHRPRLCIAFRGKKYSKTLQWISSDRRTPVTTLTLRKVQLVIYMTNARTTVQVSAYQIIYIKLNQTILMQTTTAHKRIEKQCRQQWSKNVTLFIARQHTDVRYWYCNSVCLSVRPSVRDVPVSDENGLTHCHSYFSPYGSPIILVLSASTIFTKFRRGHSLQGWQIQVGYKKFPIIYQQVAISRRRYKIAP